MRLSVVRVAAIVCAFAFVLMLAGEADAGRRGRRKGKRRRHRPKIEKVEEPTAPPADLSEGASGDGATRGGTTPTPPAPPEPPAAVPTTPAASPEPATEPAQPPSGPGKTGEPEKGDGATPSAIAAPAAPGGVSTPTKMAEPAASQPEVTPEEPDVIRAREVGAPPEDMQAQVRAGAASPTPTLSRFMVLQASIAATAVRESDVESEPAGRLQLAGAARPLANRGWIVRADVDAEVYSLTYRAPSTLAPHPIEARQREKRIGSSLASGYDLLHGSGLPASAEMGLGLSLDFFANETFANGLQGAMAYACGETEVLETLRLEAGLAYVFDLFGKRVTPSVAGAPLWLLSWQTGVSTPVTDHLRIRVLYNGELITLRRAYRRYHRLTVGAAMALPF